MCYYSNHIFLNVFCNYIAETTTVGKKIVLGIVQTNYSNCKFFF